LAISAFLKDILTAKMDCDVSNPPVAGSLPLPSRGDLFTTGSPDLGLILGYGHIYPSF